MRIEKAPGRVTAWAPAKLNLFLEVLGKRADGFHELDTVMVETDLCDRLVFEPHERLVLECPGSDLPVDDGNLVFRAAKRLAARLGRAPGARIILEKKIPMGAGLGGGSADAAAALAGLNELWGGAVPQEDLTPLAAELGSDVAFFLTGGTCRCTGKGELVRRVPGAPLDAVLVYPGVHVATPAVYRGGRIDLATPRVDSGPLLRALAAGRVDVIAGLLFNRLEGVVFAEFPTVARTAGSLRRAGSVATLMSGSGSAVFSLARDADHAAALAATAEREGLGTVFRVRLEA